MRTYLQEPTKGTGEPQPSQYPKNHSETSKSAAPPAVRSKVLFKPGAPKNSEMTEMVSSG